MMTNVRSQPIGGGRYLRLGGGTDDGVCVSTHELGGSGGMLPQKNLPTRGGAAQSASYGPVMVYVVPSMIQYGLLYHLWSYFSI